MRIYSHEGYSLFTKLWESKTYKNMLSDMKRYFKEAMGELRRYPLIGLINVIGTALAILLIMLVVMLQQVRVASFAPESGRDRFLHVNAGTIGYVGESGYRSNAPIGKPLFEVLYDSLEHVQAASLYGCRTDVARLSVVGGTTLSADLLGTDEGFWKVFDFAFLAGHPYDRAALDARSRVAVVSESVARRLFGTTDAEGRDFLLGYEPFRVCGVVRDVSTLASKAYAQVWVPYTATGQDEAFFFHNLLGWFRCTLLAEHRSDFAAIRSEIDRRTRAFNASLEATGIELLPMGRPYDQEKASMAFVGNVEPDVEGARRTRWATYLVLLLVPAINLSSMTQSRLRGRVAEIGVKRAFGCTRSRLLWQLLMENLAVTLLAGGLGLLLSVGVAYAFGDLLFAQPYSTSMVPPRLEAAMLLRPSTFGWALGACFVLNVLSAGVPAWRATRVRVVDALNGRLHR